MHDDLMELRVLTPGRELMKIAARRVQAVGIDGSFGLLARHVDVAAPLTAGVVTFEDDTGREHYVAIDQGTLLKLDGKVTIAVHRAVAGEHLEQLAELVEREFKSLDKHEREAQRALAHLEAGFVRHFLELEEH
ncbi:MAG: F0F1 ATP synthase subunit epsilon [Alphaproteobacteria bacterium]|nr:F0F1 ATP synthase subunit epsilon [Alphaproteobacteria bacterium]